MRSSAVTSAVSTILLITTLGGCDGGDRSVDTSTSTPVETTDPTDPIEAIDDGYERCAKDTLQGTFQIDLGDEYSTIQGSVADGVVPLNVWEEVLSASSCQVLEPPQLFCDPGCDSDATCGLDGECVPYPSNTDVGAVVIEGLTDPVEMDAIPPTQTYYFTGSLEQTPYASGDAISLYAAGGETEAFALLTHGVDALSVDLDTLAIAPGEAAELSWTPTSGSADTRVEITLNIALHGGNPGILLCEAEDTGSFTIPAEAIDGLLALGFSGFPSVKLSRQEVDATDALGGCVEFQSTSSVTLPVSIPGLTSCSNDDDCPDGQACQYDLTCG